MPDLLERLIANPTAHGGPTGREKLLAMAEEWANVEGCWLWPTYTDTWRRNCYAQVMVDGRNRRAHRVMYELLVGPIPPGRVLDHLCENKPCVNPAHLEPVTVGENTRRARINRSARRLR